MELINNAKHTIAKATIMLDKAGFEYLMVVIKATYNLPNNYCIPRPIIPPQPLCYTDIYNADVGTSVPLYDNDFVLRKQKCDVIFNANAYSPQKKPTNNIIVSAKVGSMSKNISVFGQRKWDKINQSYQAKEIEFFTVVPLHYGFSFGGQYKYQDKLICHPSNPLGMGYFIEESINNQSLMQQLEQPNNLIKTPESKNEPIAFSVLPRQYGLRAKYAGTFDEKWRQEIAPFLPDDFDERYFQSAPTDQQIPFPKGKEIVTLINMHPKRPEINFNLPRLNNIPVRIYNKNNNINLINPNVDTLYFEPNNDFFSVVWRCCFPIQRIHDIEQILIGPLLNAGSKKNINNSTCKK